MRPIKLQMTAFGPFAGTETVDFAALGRGCLYLVSGDTGSGKTSIFDALSFALYGEASGSRRDRRGFHSDYAPRGHETQIELDFEHDGAIYHIFRTPGYKVPKKDGSGEREHAARAEMSCDDGRMWESVREVNDAVVQILGLSRTQYAQVVMIAQGEFQQILMAGSEERRGLLNHLFGTEIYHAIEDEIRRENSAAKQELAAAKQDYTLNCGNIAPLRTAEAQAELNRLILSPERVDELIALLKGCVLSAEAENRALNAALETLGAQSTEGEKQLARAADVNRGLLQLKEAEQQESALEACRADMEKRRQRLALAESAARIAPLERAAVQAGQSLREAESRLRATEEGRKTRMAALEEAQKCMAQAEADYARRDALLTRAEAGRKLLPVFDDARRALPEAEACRARVRTALAAQQRAEREYEQLHRLYLMDQAGILADELREGEPCRVCGATHHPSLAGHIQDAPDKAAVDRAKRARAGADRAAESAAQEAAAAAERVKGLLATLRAGTDVTENGENLEACRKRCEEECRQLAREAGALSGARDEADRRLKLASAAQAEAQAAAEAARADLKRQTEAEAVRRAEWLDGLGDSGFEDEAAYRAAAMPDAERAQERRGLEEWQRHLAGAQERRASLEAAWKGRVSIDTAALQAQSAALKADIQKKSAKERELLTWIYQNRAALEALARSEKRLAAAAREAGIVQRLYQTITGQVPGASKLPFENYILQYYYRRVIASANRRLEKMSDGRYLLVSKMESSGNARSGLGLRVLDQNTGHEREVNSLSGGESFIASLSLALGFADVIQAESGQVRVDSMFIDEGFGSLDEDTLHRALEALENLTDGDRQVGVISHVAELKQYIGPKIVLEKTRGGSHIRLEQL